MQLTAREVFHCRASAGENIANRTARSLRGRGPRCGCRCLAIWFGTRQQGGDCVPWTCGGCLGSVPTGRPGRGSHELAGRWFNHADITSWAVLRSDEAYLGEPEEGRRGRKVEAKAIILVAAEKAAAASQARIRLQRVKDVSRDRLRPFHPRLPWYPVLWFTPTDRTATPGSQPPATSARSPSSRPSQSRRTGSCRARPHRRLAAQAVADQAAPRRPHPAPASRLWPRFFGTTTTSTTSTLADSGIYSFVGLTQQRLPFLLPHLARSSVPAPSVLG